jgi:hypothetical protein
VHTNNIQAKQINHHKIQDTHQSSFLMMQQGIEHGDIESHTFYTLLLFRVDLLLFLPLSSINSSNPWTKLQSTSSKQPCPMLVAA